MRFELGAWVGDAPVPLSRWQGELPADTDAALFLELDGKEWLGSAWSLGDLGVLAFQLEAAALRLASGELALVRSAEDDGDCVPYLRFRPHGDRVEITLFFLPPSEGDIGSMYPGEQLYGWVEAVGERLLARLRDDLRVLTWTIEVPRAPLIAHMTATVQQARELDVELPARASIPALQTVPLPTGNRHGERPMVAFVETTVRVGLTADEADRLASELAHVEQQLRDERHSLKGFDVFDLPTAVAQRRTALEVSMPAHPVELGAYELDVYPVTVAQWRQYMRDAGAAEPHGGLGADAAFVTGISWHEADAYARFYDLDLPSEAEWEHAARGIDRRLFTWGDRYFPFGELAFREPVHAAYPVGSRPALASLDGVHDLLGHFGEYCRDRFAPYGAEATSSQRVVRGGYDVLQDATCVSRRGVDPDERRLAIKFRCVRRGAPLLDEPSARAIDWASERTRLPPKSGVGVVHHWLVVAPPGNPVTRLDLRAIDEVRQGTADDDFDDDAASHILLVCGDLEIALFVADGADAVARIVREARAMTAIRAQVDLRRFLIVGNDPVLKRGEYLQVGRVAFRIDEVREYALRGANLPLTGGRLLQAAMSLLVVAAAERYQR